MNIISTVSKFPGGMMVIPLLIGAVIHTFCPQILQIGSFTTAAFTNAGLPAIMGFQLFCIGCNLKVREAPEVFKRGGTLLVAKWLAGALLGVLVARVFGEAGLFGVSALAIISAVTGANGSLYLALMAEYGDTRDSAALGVMNIHDGPFLALMTLGASGLANIPLLSLFAAVCPLLLGVLLGNLDDAFSKMFKPGISMVIPFIGLGLGGSIDLMAIVRAGPGGIILGLMVLIIGGGFTFFADRYIARRPGYAGMAVASAAGNTIATPAAVALVDPSYGHELVSAATAQIAAAVVLTALIVPYLVGWAARRYGCPGNEATQEEETA
ncbi:2-keto-3-deoxygluconate permease [Salmonella enterica subsp. enterica]|nr:2-keto-3-deoxygluconate permease [Salmonella enterica subsp. enterica serovar Oranienburg]MIP06435.1 2-keto-3-deoxygluconate permease [Salmonella enterica subsp. enterica serovar Oranienburg]